MQPSPRKVVRIYLRIYGFDAGILNSDLNGRYKIYVGEESGDICNILHNIRSHLTFNPYYVIPQADRTYLSDRLLHEYSYYDCPSSPDYDMNDSD